ncbi:MAG TPA: electron transfer flavoprotein subunit beta [Verrucomicrobia bacterium]|nr:electron transfer flavoprotein subunit beta [Verrucomicrobiota bacterium]
MHFVVCIKQVPGTHDVRINPETYTLMTEGVESIINPLDMYAIEEALRLRDRLGGSVTALTMGVPQAESALREALAMGVNQAILVSDSAFAGSDTWATSYTLAKALEKIGDYSVILFGKQASDGDTAQVGPSVAAFLDLPQITYVRKIEEIDASRLVAERVLESGYEVIESPLPCVLTVIKEINEPRLPSLKGKMAARKAEIVKWSASDIAADPAMLGLNGSPTKIIKLTPPPPRRGGERIEGEPDEIARKLAEKLRDIIIEAAS